MTNGRKVGFRPEYGVRSTRMPLFAMRYFRVGFGRFMKYAISLNACTTTSGVVTEKAVRSA
jgi:hypothetical protein